MTGELVPELDYVRIEPPPLDATKVMVIGGTVPHVDVALGDSKLTRADFDDRFGAGQEVPRVDFDRPYVLAYDVVVDGAPSRCTVFARFASPPTAPEVQSIGVVLRVDPNPGPLS